MSQAFSSQSSQTGSGFQASVIMPVFNRINYTYRCLEALSRNTNDVHFELVLVDNASSDGTGELLASVGGDVTVISNQENLGFARACNQGAAAARGQNLVFLNNDTVPLAGWLGAMIKAQGYHPRVAIVGSKLLYPEDETVQHAGVVFNPQGQPYHLFRHLPADHFAVNRMDEFQAVTAACLLIRREVFEELEGFDEGYINGYEDIDLCLRARQAGHKVVYTPKSVLYHYESLSPGRKAHEAQNYQRFQERWQGKVAHDENRYYARLGIRLEYYPDGSSAIRSLSDGSLCKVFPSKTHPVGEDLSLAANA